MQNLQSTGHPTWLEIQTVSRSSSGIRTVSMVRPSTRREQTAARAIGGLVSRVENGQAKFGILREFRADTRRKSRNLNQVSNLLVVNRPVDLFGPIGRLVRRQNLPKLAKFHSYKSLRHFYQFSTRQAW